MSPTGRVHARHNQMADIAVPEDAEPRRIRLHRRQKDLACGDRVEMDAAGEQIQRRLPRDNTLVRQDGFGRRKVIAANIDTVWIVIAPSPMPARFLIDRFLVAVYNLPARPRILVNKQDAGPAAPSDWLAPYAHLDLAPLHVSARSGYGLDALAEAARGHTNILIGQSGVGKSSLIAALLERHGSGDIKLPEAGDLAASGEGRHTTVTAQWYSLTGGGAWIDSPGVRDFTPELESIDALVRGFPDIEALADTCRFRNCRHQTEPGCAVREGVDQGTLPEARLEAWTALLGTLEKR